MKAALFGVLAVVLAGGSWVVWKTGAGGKQGQAGPTMAVQDSGYVAPETCATCHAAIAESYRKTGMGRSFYRLTQANTVEDFRSGKPFYHEPSRSYFAMTTRDGKYFQRRWQTGTGGAVINVDEKQIDYVMGSGNHSRTYLHLTGRNTLQELPLAWYSENGGSWGMNPGYDRAEYQGSTRPIHYECMFCHNGYPNIPQGHEEAGAEPTYETPLPEGIDCQRCHGPGRRHVEAAGKAGAKVEEIRGAIVNPKRLTPEREMEVCMACHLETSSRKLPHAVQKSDRSPFSWVPGQKLEDFHLAFDRAGGGNPDFEVNHSAYRLRQSQCFLKSGDKLRCTTCHNPHDIPRGDAAVKQYNAVCRDCHGGVVQPASVHTAEANCTGCHMPKRRTDDAVHIVMTDHRIARRPEANLLAAKKEKYDTPETAYRGEVVPYYPAVPGAGSAEYVALAQVLDRSNTQAGLAKLAEPKQAGFLAAAGEAYRSLGDAKGIPMLEEAARRAPSSEILQLQLGNALLEAGEWAKAEAALRRAAELRPDDGVPWAFLGWVQWQQDKKTEALSNLQKGVGLSPEAPELRNYLGSVLMGSGDVAGAEREFREAIRINPGIAEWHANLANVVGSRGSVEEARFEFEESLRIKPGDGPARLNYARLLANLNQTAAAETQAREAVKGDPKLSGAHELLGFLLSARNDLAGAARELTLAVQINPGSGRAHYELGLALGRMGRHPEALEHLRAAAQSADPQVRAAAQQVLSRLGR